MKYFMGALLLSSLMARPARACDICGCGVSNYNPYLFPHLSKNYLGLGFLHRYYQTRSDEGAWSSERYNTALFTAQVGIGKRLQLQAVLPWQINDLQNESGSRHMQGMGDMIVVAQFRAWDHLTKKFRQTIVVGGGLKLPTGRYLAAGTDKPEDQNFQLGSGSTDFLLNGAYRLSFRQWVFGAGASYKYNTANGDEFRYGDSWNASFLAVYRKDWDKFSLAPYIQLMHETQYRDASDHELQKISGGTVFYAGGGLDLNTKRLTIGVSYRFAADQNLAAGEIHVGPQSSAHAAFTF
jgi:hypothetical protein